MLLPYKKEHVYIRCTRSAHPVFMQKRSLLKKCFSPPHRKIIPVLLENRDNTNDLGFIESELTRIGFYYLFFIILVVLKLPPFSSCRVGEGKRAAI